MNFDQAFDRLIGNEGGYVNNPSDPGGETKWGISKRSYPSVDIADLTKDEAKEIYHRDFWVKGQMQEFDPAVSFQVFDIAVNSGIKRAIMLLQRAAGVSDDGYVGPVTLAAINAEKTPILLMKLIAERLDFWRHLSTWNEFGAGWAGRAANDLRYAAQDYKSEL